MVKWRNPIPDTEVNQWQRITAESNSGAILKGFFARSKTKIAKATIVLGHPMGKEAKGYFVKRGYTDFLRENGFNTLIFDINGFGESTNGNFLYYEDIVAIGLAAKNITTDLPIGYWGVSLGGQWATIAFTDEKHPYKFAIVESAATSLDEFWIQFPFAYRTLKVLYVILPRFAKKIRMIDRISEAKNLNSLLFIYSKSDVLVPIEMGIRFQKNSSVPSELWTVNEAKHAEIIKSEHKTEYLKKVLSYLNVESEMASF